jgi:hypothetical protein
MGNKSNNLLKMLPIFGGAAGGLAYAALTAAESANTRAAAHARHGGTGAPHGSGGPSVFKLLVGLVLLLGGGLFLFIGCTQGWNTWNIAQRTPTDVTAAELCQKNFVESAPDWVRFTFAESKPTTVTVKRDRLAGGGEVQARCVLVRVEDKWLLATVPPKFEGNDLVGRLVRFDATASRPMIEQVVKAEPKVTALLPFEFNGIDGSAADQRLRYTASGILAFVGLLGVLIGVYLVPFGRKSAVRAAPAVAG